MKIDEWTQKYDVTVGIECHVQLNTKTKLFAGADNDARDAAPNTKVSPICFGFPGVLPVLNRQAVTLAVRAGLAMNAELPRLSRFERKHYFYPDLPLGYQITQLAEPVIVGGEVETHTPDGAGHTVRIHHAHLESDAGKLTHHGSYSLVDLNRAGTPLIEIVSEPDMHSPAEAKAYAQTLHQLMVYAGVTNGDLYYGNMRFDVNVSIAPKGAEELGTRTETKNLNSFRAVEKAAEYEMLRQADVLDSGHAVVQETRGWNESSQTTFSQRSKENAHDYRYFPDADLPPVIVEPEMVEKIRAELPMMPAAYRALWQPLGLDVSVVETLLGTKLFADAVRDVQKNHGNGAAKRAANWFASDAKFEDGEALPESIQTEKLAELADMVEKNELSSSAGKEIFTHLLRDNTLEPRTYAEANKLLQVSDESAILSVVDDVLADPASAQAVADVKAGNEKAIGFLVGQVMKRSKGQANPGLAQKLIKDRL